MLFFISIISSNNNEIANGKKTQSRKNKKIQNAKKRLRYKNVDKEKIRKSFIAWLVFKNRNDPTKLKEEIKDVSKIYTENCLVNNDDNNSHECNICKIDFHRASYAKRLRSKKHLENEKQTKTVVPDWLFQQTFEINPRKMYNLKPLREIARDKIKLDDKQLNKELPRKMINPYFFTDKTSRIGFNNTLNSQHKIHTESKLTINPNYSVIETIFINIIMKEVAKSYAGLRNHFKFKYQTLFFSRF